MKNLTALASSVMVALCVAMSSLPSFADSLPDGYTQLPYLKANKNVQVKTGYTPKSTDKIVMTWCPTQVTATEALWCARSAVGTAAFTAFQYNSSKVGVLYNSGSTDTDTSTATVTVKKRDPVVAYTKYTIIADGSAGTVAVTNAFTGAEVANCSFTISSSFTVGSELCLFASHATSAATANGNWSSHFLYSFKVYDAAGTLKLDLVPAKNSSGTVGLYDTVGNSFKTKSTSTGSLTDALIDKTFDDFTLIDDEVFGKVTVNSGKTLNLNGHNLTASDIAGSGTITDTMVDLTEPDSNGNHVSSTSTFYGSTVGANLFNNNFSRVVDSTHRIILQKANLPLEVDYDFWSPRVVNSYKMYCGPGAGNRNPKDWDFYGSNDKENWTLLDSQRNVNLSGDSKAVVTKVCNLSNTTAYRYYRFKGIAGRDNGYFEMVQLEYFYSHTGELHLNVPSGKTVNNSTVSLTGKFRLFKEGDGAYIAAKANQTYTGGTELRGGTIDSSSASLAKPFGNESAVAVHSRLDVHALNYSTFNMKDGSTLDLSGCEGAFDSAGYTFISGANVTVDVTGRTIETGTRIVEWSTKPQNVTFTFVPSGVEPVVSDTGLFYGLVSDLAEFAWWTGLGNDGNPENPANWACTNAAGNVIADGLPSSPTTVFLSGDVSVQTPSGYSLTPYRLFVKDCTLTADSDMRGFGPIEIVSGCTLNLNGHKLQATEVVGTGTIAGNDMAPDHSLDLTVSDSSRVTCANTFLNESVSAATLFNNNYARDGTDNTKRIILSVDNLPLVVDYDMLTPQLVNMYRMYCGPMDGVQARCPKDWEFYGSNDNENWVLLDSRSGVTWPTEQTARSYCFYNTTPYRYYRFKGLTSSGSGSSVSNDRYYEMVQLEYFYQSVTGELHLHVPAGVTNTNSTVLFDGNLKLVKEGDGTFIAAKTDQQYLGGTDILGGTVKLASGVQDQLLGAKGSQVRLASGAAFDINDCTRAYPYNFVSDGGTLTNSGSGLGSGVAQLGSLTLTVDSVLDSTHSLGLVNASYSPTLLDLGGHTLDVNTGSGGVFRMTNCDASNGTVRVTTTSAGIMSFVNGEVRATTVDFDLSCVLNPDSPTTTVRNLLLRAPCATLANKLTISVFGRFKTETLDFPNVRLEDGSTLDLSAQEGALSTAGSSTHASQYYLTFSPNATIAVDVGARNVAVGDCLVSWPAGFAPAASVKFVLCANGVPVEGKILAVVESDDRHGIYVKESGTPDYAMWDDGWKFYTQDGEVVAGWTDGVTTNMQVRFSTAAEYTAFCNAGAVTPSAFVLTADSLTIPAGTTVDLDRTGTISVNEGTVFDVNGGHLKLPATLAGGLKAFTGTNSAEQVGTLEIAVAEGEACVNTLMALTGNLKFLKTGVGTFTAAKSGQTYSGGTEVGAGVLLSGLPGVSHPFGDEFGTGGTNLLLNGSFDDGTVTANSGSWGYFSNDGATNPNWNWTGGGGLTVAGNTWLANQNVGTYALFIQKLGTVYQDVNIDASGSYDWSFKCAKRTGRTGNYMEAYLIKLDGGGNETVTNRIASTTPGNDNFWRYGGTVKIDEPGTYRLMIYQPAASADVSNCYDDFVLRPTADTGRITVSSGGTFDFNGMRDFFNYQLALDGGTARNAGADVPNGAAQIGSVIVTAEGSRFEAQNSIGLVGYGYRQCQLVLCGHMLTVDIASGKSFWLYNTVVSDGTFDVTGAGILDIDKTGIIATNASFRIGSAMNVKVPVSVRDYIALFAGNNGVGTAALNVYGSFKPSAHNYFYGPTMQDGSTIDLSARTSSLPSVSDSWDGDRTLKFASGATVTIDVGDRAATLARGTRLMSWSAIPAGVTFTFGPEATQAGIEPVLTATGLFYGEASNVAEFAFWTGAGNDGDPTNPGNWRCVNASGDEIEDGLPSSSTIVYLGGDAASEITLQPSSGYALAPSGCVVSNCTLAADCDWRAFGTLEIADGCTVNLNGHKLYATEVTGSGTIAGSSDLTEPDVNGNHVSCNNTLYSTSVAANLFNNNYVRAGTDNTKRLIIDNANLPLVVDYDFGVGTVVNCYNIYTGPDDGGRRPKSWEFYGSNDKENWTLLDSHIGVIWPTNPQMTRAFAFENATPYRYYRFKGIESQDAGYFEMVQLEYFGPVQDELHLDIPAGATLINDSVLLTGHMKFVKEGEGTYIGRFQSQSYSGGTLVAEGTAQPGMGSAASSDTGYLYRKPFGFGSVTVAQGATFDVRSNYDYVMQEFIVEGGTFQSTGVDMTKTGWSGAIISKMTADSNLDVENTLVFGLGTMDLNGNTLSVDITPAKTLYLRGNTVTNGTIDITRGGTLNIVGATDARTVDFRVNCELNVGAALSVHDYEAAYDYNANAGTAALNVYGAFKPTVGCFYGPTMQDGSTLDLSAWPGGWPVASGFTSGNTAIRFADGATVKVKIGARSVGSTRGTKILGWTTAPAVTFVPAEGERIGLRKKDDGLYLYKGLIILVR